MSQAEGTVYVKVHRPFVLVASKPWPIHLLLLIKFNWNTATLTHVLSLAPFMIQRQS